MNCNQNKECEDSTLARRPLRSKRSGIALLITLGVSTLLLGILAVIVSNETVVNQSRANRLQKAEARTAAMSALSYALATLSTQSANTVLQTDPWASLGANGSNTQPGSETFQIGNDTARLQIVDACSFIDINTADQTLLTNLPITADQVDSLMDWREAGETARSDGAKDAYYNQLQNPYNAKLGLLDSVTELLNVKGFTASTLYDVPTNQTSGTASQTTGNQQPTLASLITVDGFSPVASASGSTKINISTGGVSEAALEQAGVPADVATAISQRAPITTLAAVLQLPGVTTQNVGQILDAITIGTGTTVEGKVNINTASQSVLQTLPGMTSDIASNIITQQSTGFQSLGDLFSVSGITLAAAAQFIDDIGVSSNDFIVRVVGTSGSTSVALAATVDISSGTPHIIRIEEQPFSDMPNRWQWYDSNTTTTLLDPTQLGNNQ